jgi:hypothetical protein
METPPDNGGQITPKKKSLLKLDDDPEFAVLSAVVRLGILIWSASILTFTYVQIPGIPKQNIDPTFIASVFTGVLATFGVQQQQKKESSSKDKDKV